MQEGWGVSCGNLWVVCAWEGLAIFIGLKKLRLHWQISCDKTRVSTAFIWSVLDITAMSRMVLTRNSTRSSARATRLATASTRQGKIHFSFGCSSLYNNLPLIKSTLSSDHEENIFEKLSSYKLITMRMSVFCFVAAFVDNIVPYLPVNAYHVFWDLYLDWGKSINQWESQLSIILFFYFFFLFNKPIRYPKAVRESIQIWG